MACSCKWCHVALFPTRKLVFQKALRTRSGWCPIVTGQNHLSKFVPSLWGPLCAVLLTKWHSGVCRWWCCERLGQASSQASFGAWDRKCATEQNKCPGAEAEQRFPLYGWLFSKNEGSLCDDIRNLEWIMQRLLGLYLQLKKCSRSCWRISCWISANQYENWYTSFVYESLSTKCWKI